jgi:5'-nucleotidase
MTTTERMIPVDTPKKILYVDMDNTLVDFTARLDGIDPILQERFKGRADELPGLFALMPPMPGALEAFRELATSFDIYLLSTAPWANPSAWQHKVEWVQLHLGMDEGTPAYKKLILSHHKNLNRGDFLVDDRPCPNGAAGFEGELIWFGRDGTPEQAAAALKCDRVGPTTPCKDWEAVVNYLTTQR